MTYNDGSTKTFNVDWNADDLAAVDTSKAGTHEVKGTVQQTTEAMYNDARADPDIFYNEDDGYYYLTGSTYEIKSTDSTNNQKDSYRSIGLKRAKTINGLKDAAEHIIIKPENGTPGHEDQYPNSFYGWSAFIWAQEFHKINGSGGLWPASTRVPRPRTVAGATTPSSSRTPATSSPSRMADSSRPRTGASRPCWKAPHST